MCRRVLYNKQIFRLSACLFLFLFFSNYPSIALAQGCTSPVISGPPAWPPFVIGDQENGTRTGPAVDISLEVFKAIGVKAQIEQIKPWKRVLEELQTGEIDMIFALLDSEERRKHFLFTDMWANDIYGVVTFKGKEFDYTSVKDLEGRIGAYFKYLKIPPPLNHVLKQGGNFLGVENVYSLYKMLELGRVDYLIVSVPAFMSLIPSEYAKDDFRVIEASQVPIPVYMGLSRKSPCVQHIDRINAELKARKKEISKLLQMPE